MSASAWTFRNTWMTHTATHAQMQPDNPAMRFRGETTTWARLSQRSLQGAAGLAERGVTKGERVAMLALNHPSFVEALLAINSAGAIAVPINFRLSPPEVDYILRDSTPSAIFVDAMLLPLLRAVPGLADVATVIVFGEAPEGTGQESDLDYAQFVAAHEPAEIVDVAEDETALIMYTSGTTGRPKGAMLSHQNLQAQAVTVIRAFGMHDESDMGFITAPFFHIASLGSIVANLLTGIPFVVHPLGAFNATEVLDAYESEGATVVFNVPQQWDLICAEPRVHERDLKLRIISWGAAPASARTLRAMADAFPDALNVAVFGQTETSPITCVLRGEESLRKQGSVGRPIPTLQYRVVYALMNDVAQGEVGEIVYRGPTVTKGYWNKPAETEDAFAGGWFHSGDLVKQDEEGFVWVVDRKKDMIISGGENIYCAEVENAISEIPSVLEVAVIGRPDDKWGQVPVAYVTVRPGDELTIDQLRSHLDGKLATYKMPKDLVTTDGLPRNAGGKIVKATLRTQDADTAS